MTVVLRNGATYQVETVLKANRPFRLQTDTTNHPAWTGEKKAMVGDDSRAAQFLRKYDNLRTPNPQEK
ncbi:g11869 [Coccomyxa viridis]|uniref:Large ribosomal subunit protein bL31c n=1 Tax=Coccomyxa viridis TaxID=1274662 RepID=A0ABP1GBM0_9CHLO